MEPAREVQLGCTNPSISHQLRYVNTIRRIGRKVTVHERETNNPEVEVFSFVIHPNLIFPISKDRISQIEFPKLLLTLNGLSI